MAIFVLSQDLLALLVFLVIGAILRIETSCDGLPTVQATNQSSTKLSLALPGSCQVATGKNCTVFLSGFWAHDLVELNARTRELKQTPVEIRSRLKNGRFSNFARAPRNVLSLSENRV